MNDQTKTMAPRVTISSRANSSPSVTVAVSGGTTDDELEAVIMQAWRTFNRVTDLVADCRY